MVFRNVLEAVFGSPAKIRILRVLLAAPQPLSGRQVGELARLSHRGAIQALDSLVELGAVQQRRVGKAYQYVLVRNNEAVERIIIPCIQAEASLIEDLKQDIKAHFGRNTVNLTLYGSLARGTEKRGSDIDVLAVVRAGSVKTQLEEKAASLTPLFQHRYNALLSLHCYTLPELKDRKALSLLGSAMKEGVTISGKPLTELLA
jgi:predicted nucleotidyltransferase